VTNSSLLSVGSAMGNHLWQTTIFTAAIWLVTPLLRKNPARIRYLLWLTASVKFLLPFSLLITLGSLLPKSPQIAPPVMYSAIGFAGEPFSELLLAPAARIARAPTLRERLAGDLPSVLECIWLCGASTVLLIWYVRWHKLAVTLRKSRAACLGREVDLLRRVEQATGRLERPAGAWHLRYAAASSSLARPALQALGRRAYRGHHGARTDARATP
jgi:bla regulator protein blaR1